VGIGTGNRFKIQSHDSDAKTAGWFDVNPPDIWDNDTFWAIGECPVMNYIEQLKVK
jgi:hypothetical protein